MCQNHEDCEVSETEGYFCMCKPEFTGTYCENRIPDATWSSETNSADCDSHCKTEGYGGAVFGKFFAENFAVCSIFRDNQEQYNGRLAGNNVPGSGICTKYNPGETQTPYRCLCDGFAGEWLAATEGQTCKNVCTVPVISGTMKLDRMEVYICQAEKADGELVIGHSVPNTPNCLVEGGGWRTTKLCYCKKQVTTEQPKLITTNAIMETTEHVEFTTELDQVTSQSEACERCQNHELCEDLTTGPFCICKPEFTGTYCENRIPDVAWSNETASTDCDTQCKAEGYNGAVFGNSENYAVCSVFRTNRYPWTGRLAGNNIPGSGKCWKYNSGEPQTPYRCLCDSFTGEWLAPKQQQETCKDVCTVAVLSGVMIKDKLDLYICRGLKDDGKLVIGHNLANRPECLVAGATWRGIQHCYCKLTMTTEQRNEITTEAMETTEDIKSTSTVKIGMETTEKSLDATTGKEIAVITAKYIEIQTQTRKTSIV